MGIGDKTHNSQDQSAAIEQQYSKEVRYRHVDPWVEKFTAVIMFLLSFVQYLDSGFRKFNVEWLLGMVLGVGLFLTFTLFHANGKTVTKRRFLSVGGVPVEDWLMAIASLVASLYVAYNFNVLAFRIGNPLPIDVFMGTALVLLILEATRRTIGISLPIIIIAFILYALYGEYFSGMLKQPGTDWRGFVNHTYLTSQGIFGVPLHVTATYVFQFVLFGAVALRMGLGRLFLNLAYAITGRYAGGPAKVSVLASAFFGMLSGSSIANTVSTGVMTIPAMKRVGYEPHFAAAVEATASTGGQITPPLMGAAAFIMAEMLGVPYRSIITAAIVPAFLHFFGVLMMVHLEAKRLGLKGLPVSEIPKFLPLLLGNIVLLLPVVTLVAILFLGMTASAASFYGTSTAIAIGLLTRRMTLSALIEGFKDGTRYTLPIISAGAAVGIIVGVVTLTGMGFRIPYIVINFANTIGASLSHMVPFGIISTQSASLFVALFLTAVTCIVLGVGVPTTATYIILVSVAAPTLANLGVPIIVAHFFVFYYGVLADITPPVAVAAYAAAGIAHANPFKVGNTAFKLANAKALVPFMFVYTPSMLIVVANFSLKAFILGVFVTIAGVTLLGCAFVGYMLSPLKLWERILTVLSALLLIVQDVSTALVAAMLLSPVLLGQMYKYKRTGA